MRIDPLRDSRWPDFLVRHREASIFHTPGWLEALRRTYGYEPVVFTTSPPSRPLENGIVFCQIHSWLTGSRLVSLPFSDHCQPLVENRETWAILSGEMEQQLARSRYRYIELRPLTSNEAVLAGLTPFERNDEYYFHKLDLGPDLDTLFRNFHKSCIQRKIQRGEREGLKYEAGRSESILAKFYHLLMLTRRRHRIPPQPVAWFRNLIDCLGENLTIHVACKDCRPVAGILTLRYKKILVYKYGGSDAVTHSLGGMPFLFWKAIQEAKDQDIQEFDLGRSEVDNPGLVKFKARLGAVVSKASYFRLGSLRTRGFSRGTRLRMAGRAFERMPDSLAQMAGSVLYRHMG